MEREQVMLQRQALAQQADGQGVFTFGASSGLNVREQVMLQRQQLLMAPACDANDFLKIDGADLEAYSPLMLDSNSSEGSTPSPLPSSSQSDASDTLEARRQFHLACEQLRRRNIKDGLEDLKACLPQSDTQRFTKATVINKAVSYIHQLQRQKDSLSAEIARLRNELSYVRAHCNCGAAAVDVSCFQHAHVPQPAPQPVRKDDFTPIQPRIEPAWRAEHHQPQQHLQQQHRVPMWMTASPPPPPQMMPAPPLPQPQQQQPQVVKQVDEQAWLEPFRRSASRAQSSAPVVVQRQQPAAPQLPAGWEMIPCPNGRTLYVNRASGESTWTRPSAPAVQPVVTQALADAPMPPGWDAGVTSRGLPFFINHANRTTTVVDPRAESTMWTSGNIPEVHASSTLLPSTGMDGVCDVDEGYGASLGAMDTEFIADIPSYDELFPQLTV